MIVLDEYFGKYKDHPDATIEKMENASDLLGRVNALMEEAFLDGIDFRVNPVTLCHVAGSGNGGFRPRDCCEGAPQSSHKDGKGVDVYDGHRGDGQAFGTWCAAHLDKLEKHGLYMENPLSTVGKWTAWVHLTTRQPASGRRIFIP